MPLSHLRHLRTTGGVPTATELVQLLRAAPQLRTLSVTMGDLTWCAAPPTTCPAFDGLFHPLLRSIQIFWSHSIVNRYHSSGPRQDVQMSGSAARLRLRHFPRLQQTIFNKEVFPVTELE
jgi:hypothetical protein